VVGTYVLARETISGIDAVDLAGRRCALTLRADGTFLAEGIPPWDTEATGRKVLEKLVSGSGTWRIDTVGAVDDGWQRKPIWGVYLDSSSVKLEPPALTGSKAPSGLIFAIVDPDAGEALLRYRTD
jgi:hypothetical protein